MKWLDYGARYYDPSVGRWWSVDPLAEKYYGQTGYNYDGDDIMPTTGQVRRVHTSARKAKKEGYPNARGEVVKDLGITTTGKAKEAEAALVRRHRENGHQLPLNRERDKRYYP